MRKSLIYWIYLLCWIICSSPVLSQNIIGTPSIINYTKETYNAGNQNWDIAQDARGIMYFANNDGLLTFDGVHWEIYKLPNESGLHSLLVSKDGKIYVGGQGEMGYFAADKNGKLVYCSLNRLVPRENNNFTDVWNICEGDNHIFFRVNSKIFVLSENKILVYPGLYWSFLGKSGNRILAHDADRGLLEYKRDAWMPVAGGNRFPKGVIVRSVLSLNKDSLLVATPQRGFFVLDQNGPCPFRTPALDEVVSKSIYQVGLLPTGDILVATRLGGCYMLDRKGMLVEKITKNEGLQSQNTLAIMNDREGNIWLGLDNGIDVVNYAAAIKHIYPERENLNSGYASAVYKNNLYLGTSAGVYWTPLRKEADMSRSKGQFELVKNSKGEIWSLSVVYDRLLIGHASGAYYIDKGVSTVLDNSIGYWGFQPFEKKQVGLIVAGTYNSINFFNAADGAIRKVPVGVQCESARFVVQHNGTIWIGHPYKGLFKVTVREDNPATIEPYVDKAGVISSNNNRIFKIQGKLVLTNDNGIFEYDDKKEDFMKSPFLSKIFGHELVSYLMEDRYGNIWFTQGKKIGVVAQGYGFSKLIYFHELENKFTYNFEHINVIDSSNVLIAAEKGFFHLNLKSYSNGRSKKPAVLIRSFRTLVNGSDSLIYGGYGLAHDIPSLQFSKYGIYISYAAIDYGYPDNIEYSYYLEGFDKQWSIWSAKTEKEFSNLPAGHYTFHVKCRNGSGQSATAFYSFIILPPWYETWWAIIIYMLAAIGVLFLILHYQQKRYIKEQQKKLLLQQREHDKEQRALQLQHQVEAQENEKRIIQLTNDKLQAELDHKNKELASSAMNLVRKIEVMSKLKEDLQSYKKVADAEKSGKEFQKIIRVIDKELDYQQEWAQFSIHFDKVHNNYLQHLKANYPELSGNDLKLCAYLKLNISTKEIAQLMNISVRGVETARFRLRKKLILPGDVNLSDFLIGFQVNRQ
ncbi:MAG: triple tyrosine motif-containing protein [Niabella sp.]